MADVENINGHNVGFAFLRLYKEHPEIGVPVSEQNGDVGGYQNFLNAKLTWTGEKVEVYWVSSNPAPDWMEGQEKKEFAV
jgi:hypothetical protein